MRAFLFANGRCLGALDLVDPSPPDDPRYRELEAADRVKVVILGSEPQRKKLVLSGRLETL